MRLRVFYQQPPETLWNKRARWRWGQIIQHPIKKKILLITFFFLEQSLRVCWFKLLKLKNLPHAQPVKHARLMNVTSGSDHWALPTGVKGHLSVVHTCSRDCLRIWPWSSVWKISRLITAMLIWIYRKQHPFSTSPAGPTAAPGVAEVRQLWGRRGRLHHLTCGLDSSVDHLWLSRPELAPSTVLRALLITARSWIKISDVHKRHTESNELFEKGVQT